MKSITHALVAASTTAAIALVLLTGLGQINLQHHLNLPQEVKDKSIIEYSYPRGLLDNPFNKHTQIDIRVPTEFKGIETVRDIGKALQEADSNDTVIFHIAGVGGEAETAFYLINNVQNSKAHVIMKVEAPSYSAHAYLAAAGDEVVLEKFSYLMYHTSSGYGTDCSKETGVDRTVSNVEHCEIMMQYHLGLTNRYLDSIKLLTAEQKTAIKTGHDVYLYPEEVNK